jgi:hypothetical protein
MIIELIVVSFISLRFMAPLQSQSVLFEQIRRQIDEKGLPARAGRNRMPLARSVKKEQA